MQTAEERMIIRKKRDFGEIINGIFDFININQRDFYRVLVLVVCPLAIIGGVFAGLIPFNPQDIFATQRNPDEIFEVFAGGAFLGSMLSIIVGYNLVITVSNVYLKLYERGNEDLSISVVWKETKKYILPVFALQLICGFILLITYIGSVLIVAMLGALFFPLAIAGFFGILLLMLYMMVNLFMVYSVCIIEEVGIFASIGRGFDLVKGHFWSSLGLFFVSLIIMFVINLLFSIPVYALEWIASMHVLEHDSSIYDIGRMVTNVLASVGSYLVLPVLTLAPAFQLFNLVEHKESVGLLARIEAFGIQKETKDEETY